MAVPYGSDIAIIGGTSHKNQPSVFTNFYTQNQFFHPVYFCGLSIKIFHFSIPTEILSIAGKYDPNFKYKTTATNLVLPDSMFVNGLAVHLENTKDCSTITDIGKMNSQYYFIIR